MASNSQAKCMSIQAPKILNVALDEFLLKSRSAILQGAGYDVVPALNMLDVERECEAHRSFDLVIIGYALPKDEKRRVMLAVRQFCGRTPILELYPHGATPVEQGADEELPSAGEPDTLLAKIKDVLAKKKKRGHAAR